MYVYDPKPDIAMAVESTEEIIAIYISALRRHCAPFTAAY
jgi:hypothetical protein